MESTNIRRMTFPRTVTVGLIAGLMVAFVVATSHAQPSASSADEQTKSRLERTWPNDDAPQSVRVTVLEQARQRAVALSNELPQAQGPSRAALLEAARRASGDSVVPPERATVEKGLHAFAEFTTFVGNIQDGWKGFHFAGGDFPTGAGFAYGIGFTDLAVGSIYADPDRPNRVDVNAVAAYSTAEYVQLGAGLTWRNLGGSPVSVAVRGQFFEYPEEDFFGLGLNSQEDDRTSYLLRSVEGGADLWWQLTDNLRVGGGASYLTPSIGSGRDDRFLSTEVRFDQTTIPGFQTQPDFLRLDGLVAFDGRDIPLHPRAGGYYGVRFSEFRDQDSGAFDFRQLEIDLQQYLPWLQKYRVLALRAAAVITDTDAGQAVPFYYMPTLGGGERLRGFRERRFRDFNSLLFTAEYRWEAWWALDVALFADAGKVEFDHSDVDLTDLEVGYGIGFRFHSTDALAVRLDLGLSREGFIPFLRFDHVF